MIPNDSVSEIFHRLGAPLAPRLLRTHQKHLAGVIEAIVSGQIAARDILAAVTPGGGKSLLPVIAAARLIASGIVERVCWVVPRESLRLQARKRSPIRPGGTRSVTRSRCARPTTRPIRAEASPATSLPTRASPPRRICTCGNSGATARYSWSTRRITSLPSPTSTRSPQQRP